MRVHVTEVVKYTFEVDTTGVECLSPVHADYVEVNVADACAAGKDALHMPKGWTLCALAVVDRGWVSSD